METLSAAELLDKAQQVCRGNWWEQRRSRKTSTAPSADHLSVADQQVESAPLIVTLSDSGRRLASSITTMGSEAQR